MTTPTKTPGLLNSLLGGGGAQAFATGLADELSPADEALRDGEEVIRSDLVLYGLGEPGKPSRRSAVLTLTNQRLILTQAPYPIWFGVLLALRPLIGARNTGYPPARCQLSLSQLGRPDKQQPEDNGDTFIETNNARGLTYRLIHDRFPWSKALPTEAQREHVEALEAALRQQIPNLRDG